MINSRYKIVYLVIVLTLFSANSFAQRPEYQLTLKNHLFYPTEIEIPENTKVKLVIFNHDTTPEEFDSFDLNREKVIFPNRKAIIFIGPLPQGRYKFFGEFNPNTAQGTIIVVPKQTELDTPTVDVLNVDVRTQKKPAKLITPKTLSEGL